MTRLIYVGDDTDALQAVRDVARTPDVITVAASEQEAADRLQGQEQTPLAIILGPDLHAPVAIAQRLRRVGGDLGLLFLCTAENLESCRTEVLTAPFVGRYARCVSIRDRGTLRSAVNAMIEHASRRPVGALIEQSSNTLISRSGKRPRLSSQVLLDRLLQTAPVGIAVLDHSHRIIAWNPACERITGFTEKKALRRPLGDVLGADWSARIEKLARAAQPEEEVGIYTRPDGLSLHLQCGLNVIDPQRPSSEQLCLLRDITARVKIQQQLLEAEKLASLGDIVAGMAHELNTPIGVCVTAASMLQEARLELQRNLDEDQLQGPALKVWLEQHDETVGVLDSNLKRAAGLIKKFRQVTAEHAAPATQEFDLGQKLGEILDSLRPIFQGRPPVVTVECPDEITLRLDPASLWQVITNLVSNAMNYAFVDRTSGTLQIVAGLSEGTVTLKVADDGVGISPRICSRIFDPFVTTGRGRGGTGLGLHLVYQIVTRQWHGTIEVDSDPDRGTEFTICFPRAPHEQA